jgi:transposase
VARAHDVNANLVFKWIRRSREGWRDLRCGGSERTLRADEAPSFVPVRLVAPEPAALREVSPRRAARAGRGLPEGAAGRGAAVEARQRL